MLLWLTTAQRCYSPVRTGTAHPGNATAQAVGHCVMALLRMNATIAA